MKLAAAPSAFWVAPLTTVVAKGPPIRLPVSVSEPAADPTAVSKTPSPLPWLPVVSAVVPIRFPCTTLFEADTVLAIVEPED